MLRIENLVKRYGRHVALDHLQLEIQKGEFFGFVGPNGAGKTTTFRIVSGLLRADAGTVEVDGVNALRKNERIKEKIGYMPDFFGVYDNLKAIEYMEFYASLYGIVGKAVKTMCYELMELVNLRDKADNYVDGLSRGMKQRLCLARSLVHNPDLLLLDEPASGLDPRARFEMKEVLMNLNAMGKTILISSHILPELAQMCNSIGIIEGGKIAVKGTVDEILSKMGRGSVVRIRALEEKETAIRILRESPKVDSLSIQEKDVSIVFHGDEDEMADLLALMVGAGVKVSSFGKREGNLESAFIEMTKKGWNQEGGEHNEAN